MIASFASIQLHPVLVLVIAILFFFNIFEALSVWIQSLDEKVLLDTRIDTSRKKLNVYSSSLLLFFIGVTYVYNALTNKYTIKWAFVYLLINIAYPIHFSFHRFNFHFELRKLQFSTSTSKQRPHYNFYDRDSDNNKTGGYVTARNAKLFFCQLYSVHTIHSSYYARKTDIYRIFKTKWWVYRV